MCMNRRDYYAAALKLTALHAKLLRIETVALASGQALPPDFKVIVAEALAHGNALAAEANSELTRRRWIARQSA